MLCLNIPAFEVLISAISLEWTEKGALFALFLTVSILTCMNIVPNFQGPFSGLV